MRRPRVLVVDDDPLFRSLMESMLREKHTVTTACDGEEGFQKAVAHPPDIAIVDVQMSGWDGLKTLRALRDDEILANLPVMMMTGDASQKTVLTAINAGATDYLIKSSFSKGEFFKKLARLLEFAENNPGGDWKGRGQSAARTTNLSFDSEFDAGVAAGDNAVQEILDSWE